MENQLVEFVKWIQDNNVMTMSVGPIQPPEGHPKYLVFCPVDESGNALPDAKQLFCIEIEKE